MYEMLTRPAMLMGRRKVRSTRQYRICAGFTYLVGDSVSGFVFCGNEEMHQVPRDEPEEVWEDGPNSKRYGQANP